MVGKLTNKKRTPTPAQREAVVSTGVTLQEKVSCRLTLAGRAGYSDGSLFYFVSPLMSTGFFLTSACCMFIYITAGN